MIAGVNDSGVKYEAIPGTIFAIGKKTYGFVLVDAVARNDLSGPYGILTVCISLEQLEEKARFQVICARYPA